MPDTLLVIDVQRTLVDALPPGRGRELIGTLQPLIARARAAGTPVVYVRHDGTPYDLFPGTPEWEIASEIAPRSSEPIVDKRHADGFVETNLADVFAAIGTDHVIACGMQTEHCVESTVQGARDRGLRVTLVEDAHATYDSEEGPESAIRAAVHRAAAARGVELVAAASLFA